jgi:signal transduction histidine kinase
VQNSPTVLIIADDTGFARDLSARWQMERSAPAITVVSTDLFHAAADVECDLAVVGPVRQGRLPNLLKRVDTGKHAVICVVESALETNATRTQCPRVICLQRHEGWTDNLVLLASECLKRVGLTDRLKKAEHNASTAAAQAALGRYMLEARHDFNNSLTSVLGNAELLMMDCAGLPDLARDQIETIHEMSLHLHAVMQRFSSLAMEMQAVEKQSQDETERQSHASYVTS